MTNGQWSRLQRLMLIDEERPLTAKERAEFDDLWSLAEAEMEGGKIK